MNIRIIPHNMGSSSCKALQAALQERGHKVLRVNRNSPTYQYRPSHKVINWGCGSYTNGVQFPLNQRTPVWLASHKISTFNQLGASDIAIPKWTTDILEAAEWCRIEGHTIVERHVLNGHSGEGIRLVENANDLELAPLYTVYQKKTHEFRVHVLPKEHGSNVRNTIINQKRRRREVPNEEVNWQIRNYRNGFVYSRDNVDDVPGLKGIAVRAVEALCLDFGAVDILWHSSTETMLVLEVNTAPGLAGSLVDVYADAFIKAFGE